MVVIAVYVQYVPNVVAPPLYGDRNQANESYRVRVTSSTGRDRIHQALVLPVESPPDRATLPHPRRDLALACCGHNQRTER